jgi:hypothetical protein
LGDVRWHKKRFNYYLQAPTYFSALSTEDAAWTSLTYESISKERVGYAFSLFYNASGVPFIEARGVRLPKRYVEIRVFFFMNEAIDQKALKISALTAQSYCESGTDAPLYLHRVQ